LVRRLSSGADFKEEKEKDWRQVGWGGTRVSPSHPDNRTMWVGGADTGNVVFSVSPADGAFLAKSLPVLGLFFPRIGLGCTSFHPGLVTTSALC
jgi:hypothetical protein